MIYCFDLDGTLVTSTEDGSGKPHYHKAQPIYKHIEKLRKLYKEGHKIVIQTARGSGSGIDYTELTESQITKNTAYLTTNLILVKNLLPIFTLTTKALNVKSWI